MSAVAHDSELAQSMDLLQYVRASPQSIPDEHLNPSSEVVRLVHAPAGETIGEGYTCTVHLPSSLPPEDVGMVNLAGQRPSSHSSTAASARASITLASFALRVTKKGHQADVNRDINRCGRLPEIDYGGCLESLWPVKQGYMVEGKGGAQHRPPAECTTRPFVCLRSDYYRLVWATRSWMKSCPV